MLVAQPGQTTTTTTYVAGSKKSCLTNTSSALATSNLQRNNNIHTVVAPTSSTTVLMKTLSVRLNRGNEFIKGHAQKSNSSSNLNNTNGSLNSNNANQNNINSSCSALCKNVTPSISFLKMYTIPPTKVHRYPERSLTSSTDSLSKELCHFKPIRTAPTTPWKM